jgi:hypothetical protein
VLVSEYLPLSKQFRSGNITVYGHVSEHRRLESFRVHPRVLNLLVIDALDDPFDHSTEALGLIDILIVIVDNREVSIHLRTSKTTVTDNQVGLTNCPPWNGLQRTSARLH